MSMSDSKNTPTKWKAEELRSQRKTRLAQMKSKEGGKKPVRTKNPVARLVVILIVVVALIITGIWTVVRLGIPQRELTALTIGSEKIKAIELNYYYHSLLSTYSVDPTTAEGQATLKAASGIEGFATNADYLKDMAAKQLQQSVLLADKAKQGGLALGDDELQQIKDYFASLVTAAAEADITYENYLISTFGVGATEAALQPVFERYLLASKYAQEKEASFTFTDAELQTGYEVNKDGYDVVTYRIFNIAAESKTGATDAEKTKAMEAARTKANAMLAKITDGESFRALCIEYATETAKPDYEASDLSLMKYRHKSDVSVTAQSTWLFDATRKAGDKTLLETTTGFYVLYLEARAKPEYQLVDIRHILISAAKATATADEIDKAKTKAESVLAEFLAGDKTEESFGALAAANSADSNAAQGGIYTAVAPGQMVETFNDWCFDTARKAGDTGIVQTDFGFHVMYFIRQAGEDWKINVATTLRGEAYSAYLTEEAKNYPYQFNSLGMRFVG